ncbi:MAG: DUF2339 domain-containing protein, partial [Candidatus Hydrogenedentes bacterium]|nr:DUF2339 domain-containing protein [Candidatus Hydrogenedentota bacterium]
MSYQDELRNLRWELEQLLRKGESLSSRLEALEARALKEGAKAESATPPAGTSLPPAPPPLPSIVSGAPAVGLAPSPGREPELAMLSDVPEQAPPQPKLAPLPLGPSLSEQIAKVLKKLGPKEEMNWEMALWTWWMPRIAIVVLVIGVVGGMAYAIEQLGNAWWIPYFRLAMGYSTCAALLVLGKYLEHRFTNYARVLLSGGIALSYFVTFATHYVRFTRVFVYPEPTLVLLGLIVVIWGTVAQYRKSVLVACAVTALGHLTVALSTLTLEPPSRFAVVGLLALSVVSAFYLAWNRWYKVAAIGMVGSYLNHFFWLAESPPSDAVIDFIVAMSVLAVYFLIFALAEYVAPAELRRRAVSFRLRSAYASFNSAAFFVLGYSIMRGFDFARDYTYVFYFALAAVLAVFAFSYWLRRAADPLHNLYFTKAASVATLGFATYFDGAILTATLAVEAVVLLMGARRSGLVVSRLLAHAVAVLAFFHGLYVVFEMPWPATYVDPAFAGMMTSSAVAVLALLAGALLYQRTDWSTRGLGAGTRTNTNEHGQGGAEPGRGLRTWIERKPDVYVLLWQHDLMAAAPREGLNKPLEGLFYPYSYTFGAAILGVLFTNRLLEQVHTAPALGLLALTLTVAGVLLSNKPYTSGALIWAVFGAFAWLLAAFVEIPADALNFRDHMYDAPRYAEYLVSGVFALLPLLLLAELVRLARPQDTTLWLRGRHADDPTPLPDIYALSASLVLLTGVIVLAEPGHRLLALAMAAAAFGGYALVVPAPAIGTLPFLASVSSAVFFTGEVVDGLPALT